MLSQPAFSKVEIAGIYHYIALGNPGIEKHLAVRECGGIASFNKTAHAGAWRGLFQNCPRVRGPNRVGVVGIDRMGNV